MATTKNIHWNENGKERKNKTNADEGIKAVSKASNIQQAKELKEIRENEGVPERTIPFTVAGVSSHWCRSSLFCLLFFFFTPPPNFNLMCY